MTDVAGAAGCWASAAPTRKNMLKTVSECEVRMTKCSLYDEFAVIQVR